MTPEINNAIKESELAGGSHDKPNSRRAGAPMSILWEPHALAGPPTLAEQNWKALGALSNADRSSLLYFLFGYFERNEKFQEQIAWWLKEFEKT